MAKTKAVVDQRESTEVVPTQVERQSEAPVKRSQPRPTALARKAAFSPPAGSPSRTEAPVELPAAGTIGRARLAGCLQRSMGNAGMSHMYRSGVQTKLTVSTPSDPYEQEADRIADEIMHGSSPPNISESTASPVRLRVPQETAASNDMEQTPEIDRVLSSPGQSLDENTRHLMEQQLQHDFSRVRVHTDNAASESARSLQASAYTVSTDIVFANGRYAPNSEEGMALLAHELVHVKQQTPVGDGVRRKPRIQREEGAGSAAPQDPCAGVPQSVAQSLLGEGREGRGRTFAPRLTTAENRRWAALPEACRNDPEQCPGPHSHRPRPRTPWSLSRLHGRIHAGMDVQAPRSTPVYAPIHGSVIQAEETGGMFGNVVMLLHQCPPHTEQFGDRPVTTIYAHMDSISASVTTGATVEAGDQIGTVGDTGVPGRVHLHFSVQRVPRSGPPRAALSTHEERQDIRIRPDNWLAALGIPIAPTVTVQPAVTQPAQQTPPVVQRHPNSIAYFSASDRTSGRTALYIQRKPSAVTAYTFLGLAVRGGVNPTMQARLSDVSEYLEVRFFIVHGRFPRDVQELREWAGVTDIGGWRHGSATSRSKHCSGSAVDVNYRNQPYIVTRTTTGGTTVYGGELEGRHLSAQRRAAAAVYDRAIAFVYGGSRRADVSARPTGGGSTPRETTEAVYQRFRSVSDALSTYLGLAFHTAPDTVSRRPIVNIEGATEAQLLTAIPTTERKGEAAAIEDIRQYILNHSALSPAAPDSETYHWSWEDSFLAREFYFRMLRDYEHVRIPMQRGTPEARPPNTRNPARGFLNMTEEFVVAMADVGALRWGIADFPDTESGDTHHFDLGNHGGVTPDCSL